MRELKGEKLEKELQRLDAMLSYEREYASLAPLCGIDEAGRGPLAGPVAAAAVILPENCRILYLNDSKKLSPARRDALFDERPPMKRCGRRCAVSQWNPARF